MFEERENSQRISKIYQKILSIVGHDIRGPLNTFTQLVELLMDGKVSYDDFLKLAPNFKKNMQNTTTLLDNLVDWGREYIKGNNYNFSDINIYHIVEKVKCNFVTQANIKGIKIINKVSNGLVVHFDENILHFIIRNLVSNALKFTQTGKIEIEANVTGSH